MDARNGFKCLAGLLRRDVCSAPLCRAWIRRFTSSEAPSSEFRVRCDVREFDHPKPNFWLIDSRFRHQELFDSRVSENIAESRFDRNSGVTGSGSAFASPNRRRGLEQSGKSVGHGVSRRATQQCNESPCSRIMTHYSVRSRKFRLEAAFHANAAGKLSAAALPWNAAKTSKSLHIESKSGEERRDLGSSSKTWEGKIQTSTRAGFLTSESDQLFDHKRRDKGRSKGAVNAVMGAKSWASKVTTENVSDSDHLKDEQSSRQASGQAMALLRAALDVADGEQVDVPTEYQRSLRVGVVGAPNAGKSLLTNQLVGTRVSAVSPKTNTTHRDHLGVFTKDEMQLLFYDTPGLHLAVEGTPLRVDLQHRVRSAWDIADFCDALVVLIDAERQIRRPDKRVLRLVERLGSDSTSSQKRILCLNKVDMIEQKRLLLPLAKQFEALLGYERIFMISGKTGSGVEDVKDYLLDQAILRPWESDSEQTDQRDVALEVVREHVFDKLHEELPHATKQKLVSWKVLKDGSIRIQQLLLVPKKEHQKILVGTNGAVIGEIGIKARKELQQLFGATVHLILDVKPMSL